MWKKRKKNIAHTVQFTFQFTIVIVIEVSVLLLFGFAFVFFLCAFACCITRCIDLYKINKSINFSIRLTVCEIWMGISIKHTHWMPVQNWLLYLFLHSMKCDKWANIYSNRIACAHTHFVVRVKPMWFLLICDLKKKKQEHNFYGRFEFSLQKGQKFTQNGQTKHKKSQILHKKPKLHRNSVWKFIFTNFYYL